MKNLILILFPIFIFSQNHIQLEIHQDFKLAFLGDDHNNKPFTPDFKISIALQGNQFDWYYFEMKPSFEYANLSGGKFVMWNVNAGWVFNKLINKIEIGTYLTGGLLHRFNESWLTYGITSELSYKLTERLKIGLMCQLIDRPDVDKFGISNYIGLKYIVK